MGRNFANKIWNAYNVFGQFMEEGKSYKLHREAEDMELVERWMLHRLNTTIQFVDESLQRYRLNEALSHIYDAFWHDYCDWFLELIKPDYGDTMSDEKIALALEVFEKLIQLLHPFMPFITEDLWWRMRPRAEGEACICSEWPHVDPSFLDPTAQDTFGLMQELISGIRNVKSEYGVAPGKEIEAILNLDSGQVQLADTMKTHAHYFLKLAKVSTLDVGFGQEKPKASASKVAGSSQVYIPLAGMIDLDVERQRLQKEIDQKNNYLAGLQRKLQNENFVTRAPAAVVEGEKEKARTAQEELEKLVTNLAELE